MKAVLKIVAIILLVATSTAILIWCASCVSPGAVQAPVTLATSKPVVDVDVNTKLAAELSAVKLQLANQMVLTANLQADLSTKLTNSGDQAGGSGSGFTVNIGTWKVDSLTLVIVLVAGGLGYLWLRSKGKVAQGEEKVAVLGSMLKLGKDDSVEVAGPRVAGKVDDLPAPAQAIVLDALKENDPDLRKEVVTKMINLK